MLPNTLLNCLISQVSGDDDDDEEVVGMGGKVDVGSDGEDGEEEGGEDEE